MILAGIEFAIGACIAIGGLWVAGWVLVFLIMVMDKK